MNRCCAGITRKFWRNERNCAGSTQLQHFMTAGVPPWRVGHIPGCRVVFFRDPEGNIIEFIEGYRDEG